MAQSTPALTRRIVRHIKLGVPSEIAARLCGVSLSVFTEWLRIGQGEHPTRRATPRYRTFAAAIDQAEAVAISEHVKAINTAIKRVRVGSARWGLTKRAAQYFPPPSRGGVEIANITLVKQIQSVQAEQAKLIDPRLALEAEQERTLTDLERGIIAFVPDPALNQIGRAHV